MKAFIRRWLGLVDLDRQVAQLQWDFDHLRSDFTAAAYDEHDPRRKEASDRLTQRHIARLEAEQKVRDHYGY